MEPAPRKEKLWYIAKENTEYHGHLHAPQLGLEEEGAGETWSWGQSHGDGEGRRSPGYRPTGHSVPSAGREAKMKVAGQVETVNG